MVLQRSNPIKQEMQKSVRIQSEIMTNGFIIWKGICSFKISTSEGNWTGK